MRPRTILSALALLAIPALLACHDDKSQAQTQPAFSAKPIPSGLVYNSFFADKKAAAEAVVVSPDGGAIDAGPAAAGAAKLNDPGSEPRTALSYHFALGKPKTVVATITASVEGKGMRGMSQSQPPIRISFAVTPKTHNVATHVVHFETKVTHVEIVADEGGLPPDVAQVAGALDKALAGIDGSFDASTAGVITNVKFNAMKMPAQLEQFADLLQKTFELLIVPLPAEPVGVGAKWTTFSAGPANSKDEGETATVTLLSQSGDALSVKIDTVLATSITPLDDPQAPPGTTVKTDGSTSYEMDLRLDGIAQKGDGHETMTKTITVPGKGTQTIDQKIAETIATVAGAAHATPPH